MEREHRKTRADAGGREHHKTGDPLPPRTPGIGNKEAAQRWAASLLPMRNQRSRSWVPARIGRYRCAVATGYGVIVVRLVGLDPTTSRLAGGRSFR